MVLVPLLSMRQALVAIILIGARIVLRVSCQDIYYKIVIMPC